MLKHLKILILYLVFIFCSNQAFAQDKFNIVGKNKSYSMPFKMVNNLIIIPIEVNGGTLDFLLDTGVNNSIMFNLSVEDSLKLKEIEKIRLRGLGVGDYIDAIKSNNNVFKIGKIIIQIIWFI